MYYTGRPLLDLIYYVLQCFTTENPDKATIVELRQDKELYKIFACDKFKLLLIFSKPLVSALATLHMLFIWASKFN